jgi:hypothetical protein
LRTETMTSPRERQADEFFGKEVTQTESSHSLKLNYQKKKIDFPKI